MQVNIELTGITPLLMHSAAGVNSEHPLNKAKALLTKKTASKRTEEENREIERLEWLLGAYISDGDIVYPTANVVRCFKEAGKVTKQGTQLSRGPRNGHRSIEDLFHDPIHGVRQDGIRRALQIVKQRATTPYVRDVPHCIVCGRSREPRSYPVCDVCSAKRIAGLR